MQFVGSFALLLALSAAAPAAAGQVNPLEKVLEMIDQLHAKVTAEGEAEDKAYHEYVEWCDDAASNTANEIKTATTKTEDLTATIDKLKSDISDSDVKIGELVAAIAKDSKELAKASEIRDKENADFKAEEADLLEGIDTLDRAIGIIQKALAQNPGAFAQVDTKSMTNVVKVLGTILDAAAMGGVHNKKKLLAMVQSSSQASEEDEQDPGAPAPQEYASKAGGIVDVLEDMKDKAEEELSGLRAEETTSANNFALLKQSLEDSMTADNKDLADEKDAKASATEEQATAEGDLEVAKKALAEGNKMLETTQQSCMTTATDHAESTKSRAEELKVISEAKKIIVDSTAPAGEQTYSFLQMRAKTMTKQDVATAEVMAVIKDLAKRSPSAALTQLVSRISTVVKFGKSSGQDPFEKVKGLITDLIAKLEKEAEADANEKAYCDEQMSKTEAKKADLDDTIEKLTTKIDKATSKSTALKEDVKALQEDLAKLLAEQTEMDKLRKQQHDLYLEVSADLKAGLAGVRKALEMLRNYYGGASLLAVEQPKMPEYHSKAGGAGGGIISMLEVVESDFATGLATAEKEESDAAADYEKTTQENEVSKTNMEQDIKYKTQEYTALDKSIADNSGDLETTKEEHAAVMEYYEKVKDRCIAKPETYEEIKARRDAEIKGLKEALSILEGSALAQTRKHGHRHHFLGM